LDNAFYVVLLASGIGLYKAGGITGISSYIWLDIYINI
jgi:hypothetical protein